MEKLLAMNIAAQLANAVAVNFPDNLAVDPEIKDQNLRAENLAVWELFRVFYRAVSSALADETSWPQPKVGAGNLLSTLAQSLLPFVSGPLGDTLKKLIAPAAAITGPVPDPGAAQPK